mmetsp:Transcript_1926/g.3054  ORF Transcript_1926/g.3054 Transcript_1926/m.3054 type:complete len:843 (+) Transcript_1926:23-2551(+)|eukprot:CAMPEP_0185031504 /NCGR_PEP_ID=MMETSP1103-20130426/19015_1 /TAXON_ID=36769 /ORGANISM="Paraphysomonas bandaiensis, Strain Caron Lab Isolate" /LENGTH=842 /DNA_ID=CAMNT_0027567049 /DNA_START=20 /DNA_END=2548 /DNA_ORIENTATION=-
MLQEILYNEHIDNDISEYIINILNNDPSDLSSIQELLDHTDVNTDDIMKKIKSVLGDHTEPEMESVECDVRILNESKTLNSRDIKDTPVIKPLAAMQSMDDKGLLNDKEPLTENANDEVFQDDSHPTNCYMDDNEEEAALQAALDDTDDFASAWQECKAEGRVWGGRGYGGRGVARRYQCASKGFTRDVVVDGVTLAFAGKELLSVTTLRLVSGRRYALLGRNGMGKSTLLRRIAAGALPGFPQHLTVSYLAQEPRPPVGEAAQRSSIDALLLGACKKRKAVLEAEREDLEAILSGDYAIDSEGNGAEEDETDRIEREAAIAERLGELDEELKEMSLSNGGAREKCYKMLSELGFDEKLINTPVGTLSGGWRMRVELASALIAKADILLLDEPTNHLDLRGVLWLESYLLETSNSKAYAPTMLIVSHDRAFVAAVATDIIVMEGAQLRYFDGGLEAFEQREEERAVAHEHRLDARVRQETAAREAAAKMKQRAVKSGNDNAMRAAKQRLNKIDRVGLFRDDGKRFKTRSLQKLDESYSLLPSRVEARAVSKNDTFIFPSPLSCEKGRALVSLDSVTLVRGEKDIVRGVNAFLYPGTRAAVVGDNGAGKTTLLQALAGALEPCEGTRLTSQGCKIAFVSQHHADELMHKCISPREGAAEMLARLYSVSELESRARLGKFGISGNTALLPLKSLSGGQRVRVSLASITWDAPDVLLLDEPTNHCDMSALDALSAALSEFPGAVAVVSHNRSFLAACCTELWIVENRSLRVERPPPGEEGSDDAFSLLFAEYATRVLGHGTGGVKTYVGSNSRAARTAAAIDSSKSKRRGKDKKSGAASERSGFI